MVDALEATGALDDVAEGIISVTGGDRAAELLGILWVAGIGSGLVDNILITAAMIPVVDALAADDASVALALALLRRERHHRRGRGPRRRLRQRRPRRLPDRVSQLPEGRAAGHLRVTGWPPAHVAARYVRGDAGYSPVSSRRSRRAP